MTPQQNARLQAAVQQLAHQIDILSDLLPQLQRQRAALDRAAAALNEQGTAFVERQAEQACRAAIARARGGAPCLPCPPHDERPH